MQPCGCRSAVHSGRYAGKCNAKLATKRETRAEIIKYERVAYAPVTRRCQRCARPSPRHACEHAAARQLYWRRSRVLVLHSGAHVQAAACPRMRSVGSHAVCKKDANAYYEVFSPMPVAASTLTGRRRPSTRDSKLFKRAPGGRVYTTPPRRAPRVRMQQRRAAVQTVPPAALHWVCGLPFVWAMPRTPVRMVLLNS